MRLRRIAHGINLTENILAFDGPVSREQIKPPGKLSAAMARIKAGRSRQLPRACPTPTCRPLWVRRSRSRTPTDSDRQVTLLSCPSIPGSLPLDHPINGQAALTRAVPARRCSPIAAPTSGRCSQGGSRDSSRCRVRARLDGRAQAVPQRLGSSSREVITATSVSPSGQLRRTERCFSQTGLIPTSREPHTSNR